MDLIIFILKIHLKVTIKHRVGSQKASLVNGADTLGLTIYSVSDEYTASCDNVMTVSLDGDTLMNENDYISVRNEIDDILNKNFNLK